MNIINKELIRDLQSKKGSPCISLYMPTHRNHPDNLQDPIRFQNLTKQLKESLLKKYSAIEINKLLEPFETLRENADFWNHTYDGIAVFSSFDYFKVYNLPVYVKELVIAADSFHTKPIRNYLQTIDHYHILGLSNYDIRFFEGNRYSISEITLPDDFPKNITEALGEELTEKHRTVASYGGVGRQSTSMHHGHGAKKDEIDKDSERFFRVIANNIYEKYSKKETLPLILAALPEHHNLFYKVNKNPYLITNGIMVNPSSVSEEKLINLAWKAFEPEYLIKLKDLTEKFEIALANNLGSDNVYIVAEAANAGKVEMLLLEANLIIPGKLSANGKSIETNGDLNNPDIDDVLDDIGELVTKTGGEVFILPKNKMPVKTGLAAIFRY